MQCLVMIRIQLEYVIEGLPCLIKLIGSKVFKCFLKQFFDWCHFGSFIVEEGNT